MSIQTITIIFNRKLIEKERYTLMSKEYYTIIRKYYGLPDYLNTDLSKKEDCFAFDTEYEAKQCLRDIFENGEYSPAYDVEYNEDDIIERVSNELNVEINNIFVDGDKYCAAIYFTVKKLEQ